MRKMHLCFCIACLVVASVACNSIDLPIEDLDAPAEWKVSIQATMADTQDHTKALSESGNAITALWEAGDVVYICNDNYDYGQLTAQSAGTSTKLSGTITKKMTVGATYTLRYLQKGSNFLYLPSQKGTLEDIAKNHDMAEATVTVKSVDGNEVVFNETSVNFQSKVSITKFTFDRSITNVTIFCSNLKTYVRPGYSAKYGFIDVVPDAETSTIHVAMSTVESKKSVYVFLVKGADGLYYMASKKALLEDGKNYATSVTLSAMPDYIDLGIVRDEKHVCWATKNLGASTPGATGNYFAWGETDTKTSYTWDNYKWGKYSWVTKYDPDRSDQGVVDGLAYLLPEDDAATKVLGNNWRTPSYDDFNDLLNASNVESIRAYADGIWGYCFHSVIEGYESKFIFIPMTHGYYEDATLKETGKGYYWSNKIDQISWTSSSFANILELGSYYSGPETSRMQRAYGLVVRPVHIVTP